MRKHKASDVVNISNASTGDSDQSGNETDESNDELSEEPSEEYVSQPSSASDDDEEQTDKPDIRDVQESKDPQKKSDSFRAIVNNENASEKEEHTGGFKKVRRSRWDPQPDDDRIAGEEDRINRKRKSRWESDNSQVQLPDFVKKLIAEANIDSEIIRELNTQLLEINRKLNASEIHDDRPVKERSVSPPPVYNNLGIRINSRDVRFRNKLMEAQKQIISRLLEKKTLKPPVSKPKKLTKKLYIPSKEYPDYNFVGLIIGPQGITQKRMQEETGASIRLRGKGSGRGNKPEASNKDDLHVLIEADQEDSLNAAVKMVEKLLIPMADGMNDHKRSQLRELARLKGTHRDDPDPCYTCGSVSHTTLNCPLTASTPGNQYHSFLAELGGGGAPTFGTTLKTETKSKAVDYSHLFVTYLPQTVDSKRLLELFTPFGRIVEARVIMDRVTGVSKGYGFVKYDDPVSAATAVASMNRYKIDHKTLVVSISGQLPQAGSSSISLLPKYPGPGIHSQDNTNHTVWPGPPGSVLPESESSFSKGLGLGYGVPPPSSISSLNKQLIPSYGSVSSHQISPALPSSFTEFPGNPDYISQKGDGFGLPLPSVPLGHSNSFTKPLASSYGSSSHKMSISEPSSLSEFHSNLDYPNSRHLSYFTPPTNTPAPQLHHAQYLESSLTSLPQASTLHPQSDTKFVASNNEKFASYMPW